MASRGTYDVIIVGAGPAGIFAALTLARSGRNLSVLILEKGPDIHARRCPRESGGGQLPAEAPGIGGAPRCSLVVPARPCRHCAPCSLLCGWGGAGAFSDGKLTLTSRFGGFLDEYLGAEAAERLIAAVDRIYLEFGAVDKVYGTDEVVNAQLKKEAARAGMEFVAARIRHLGTENCKPIVAAMREYLEDKVDVLTGVQVTSIVVDGDSGRRSEGGPATGPGPARTGTTVRGVMTADGREFYGRYVIVAPGREGSQWFRGEAQRLGLNLAVNPVDIGVRVEVPAVVMDHITDAVYEPKLLYLSKSFDDPVRTFCVCPHGEVVMESSGDLMTVNGHSYASKKTANTNFAILVSKTFTEPFKEPIAYGKYIASLANLLGGAVLVQRLGDLLAGRRSTEKRIAKGMVRPTLSDATPGDLSLVLPYRYLIDILEMLRAMDRIAPGVHSTSTLLYGVEVKFYSSRVEVSPALETGVRNLFVAGDGAGITRGLAQASASGMHVAMQILGREGCAPKVSATVARDA